MKTSNTQSASKPVSLKATACALALAGALSVPVGAWAQAVPFEAEGVVTAVSPVQADGSVVLTVFGRQFTIPNGAAIHTPTATLTPAQLADPTRFPGRDLDGFIGGTAILVGESSIDVNGNEQAAITNVEIEPAETVLLGSVTRNDTSLYVMGVPMVASTDPRLPLEGVHNEYGFPVILSTIPVGVLAAVEGYFAPDGNFHYFLVEAGGGDLVDPNSPQSAILRARCDSGGRLEVQGSTYLPANVPVEFFNAITGERFGQITPTLEPGTPFGVYRYRTDVNEGEPNTLGACPSEVRARTLPNNDPNDPASTTAIASVDGVVVPAVIDPDAPNVAPVAANDIGAVFTGLATAVDVLANDTDANGNIDNTLIVFSNVSPALTLQNTNDGHVMVTASIAGTHSFDYTVADTDGAVSNVATVTITAQDVAMDTVEVIRANFRADKTRWEVRGTTNQPGQVITVTLVRTGAQIGTPVTANATGAWLIDVRNTNISPINGDVVRASSNGGGSAEFPVSIR